MNTAPAAPQPARRPRPAHLQAARSLSCPRPGGGVAAAAAARSTGRAVTRPRARTSTPSRADRPTARTKGVSSAIASGASSSTTAVPSASPR